MSELKEKVARELGAEAEVQWRSDHRGSLTGWCRISAPAILPLLAERVAALEGRLISISGCLCPQADASRARELSYHFDLDGVPLTVTVELPLKDASVPSLAAIFRNANWSERELMELHDIRVTGHPDPRPLFLHESIAPAVLERLIPYSAITNAARKKTAWERVLPGSEGGRP